ncbi:MAG: shikimate dehydrogenase [Erysipelotrichales bacterium]|nr:shikimate dehydrogenase [Erysipelotrichales bacterium]
MRKYGLIGYPLRHSWSRGYFTNKFKENNIDAFYDNLEIENLEGIKDLLVSNNYKGFNVTIPYKEKILGYVDGIDDKVNTIKACNCIKIIDGIFIGTNTDIIGFKESYKDILNPNKKALILGTGGASKSVAFVLDELGIKYKYVSRSYKDRALEYKDLNKEIINSHKIIINTTPLGTFPNINQFPDIPYDFITPEHVCIDLIYNPEKTLFLQKCEKQGATIRNGYDMLIKQAEASWDFWNS